jgi:hypothetical protein
MYQSKRFSTQISASDTKMCLQFTIWQLRMTCRIYMQRNEDGMPIGTREGAYMKHPIQVGLPVKLSSSCKTHHIAYLHHDIIISLLEIFYIVIYSGVLKLCLQHLHTETYSTGFQKYKISNSEKMVSSSQQVHIYLHIMKNRLD